MAGKTVCANFIYIIAMLIFFPVSGAAYGKLSDNPPPGGAVRAGEHTGDSAKDDKAASYGIARVQPEEARIEEEITISVKDLEAWIEKNKIDKKKIVLFLDGMLLDGASPRFPEPGKLVFRLGRTKNSESLWSELFRMPLTHMKREIHLGVGPENGPILTGGAFKLIIVSPTVWLIGLFILALTLAFVIMAKRSSIIRDSGGLPPGNRGEGVKTPYNLARLQMAIWFFLTTAAFLFIGLATANWDTINSTSLTLMGIAAGTALGGALIDDNKNRASLNELASLRPQEASAKEEVATLQRKREALDGTIKASNHPDAKDQEALDAINSELAKKAASLDEIQKKIKDATSRMTAPNSSGFLTDILSDANGYSFHRFQMFIWTIILGGLFLRGVFMELRMPPFSETQLTLMGVSAGTYLGFKLPERPTG